MVWSPGRQEGNRSALGRLWRLESVPYVADRRLGALRFSFRTGNYLPGDLPNFSNRLLFTSKAFDIFFSQLGQRRARQRCCHNAALPSGAFSKFFEIVFMLAPLT